MTSHAPLDAAVRPRRIMFASGHPYLPQLRGGVQSNTHELANALRARGHSVSVLSGLTGGDPLGLRNRLLIKLGLRSAPCDKRLGYPVYRSWHAWLGASEAVLRERPDLVVAQSGKIVPVIEAMRGLAVPVLGYLHNVEYDDHGGDFSLVSDIPWLANSHFTAGRYRRDHAIEASVLPPIFQRKRYLTESVGSCVTFFNPHPLKGVDIAIDVARRLPKVSFLFVRGWTLDARQEAALQHAISGLPNVRLVAATDDLVSIYRQTKIVLVPSRWEETWGRVVSEAQFSGIPTIATDCGGLPEAVGAGGLLLPMGAGGDEWARSLRDLLEDHGAYARLARSAHAHARRPMLDPDHQVKTFEAAIRDAVATTRAGTEFTCASHSAAGR